MERRQALVSPEYDDLRPFVVTALSLEQMLAEKVRALLARGKPRDLYDLWLLTQQGIEADLSLIQKKLALYDLEYNQALFETALDKVQTDWERELKPLLPQPISWDEVKKELEIRFT